MRFILGFLSGVLGLLAGWSGLAALVVALGGPDRDGGLAMGAFFNIGPIGGLIGFATGVWLFVKFGIIDQPPSDAEQTVAVALPARTRVSRIFAGVVVVTIAVLAWWGWYELIRSPYLSHGYMRLDLQFRLPSGMALPEDVSDVHIAMEEGPDHPEVMLGRAWHGTDGDRRVILAYVSLSRKTSHRLVTLAIPGVTEQNWQIDLGSDPDPMPGYSPWRTASGTRTPKIEMNFHLGAER